MLIRASGYNTGAQEYLEQGNKSGREFTRDELDHRLVLDGQLSLTRAIYESIPDYGQDRYLTFTLSFKEDEVSPEVLKAITADFKQFMMHAYKAEEFNFYAEAHLPKMKTVIDKRTGDLVDRKPHIHIIIPRINLLSGNEANPVGVYQHHEKYFEAIQEHLNQKYGLSSPRENIRADVTDAASVLSRYKGDDFYGKNRTFKQDLVKAVIDRKITTRAGFYELVAEYGETRVRNQGKENEYLSVKLPGDTKGTNLKDTIFGDDFIVRRELKKAPMEPAVIQQRLSEWPQRAREIKYVHKATPSFRERYAKAGESERHQLLSDREAKFYQIYGEAHDNSKPARPRDHQRSPAQTRQPDPAAPALGVQNVPIGDVAIDGQAQPPRVSESPVLLPRDAHVHVGQPEPGGNLGLRPPVPGGRRGRGRTTAGERTGRRKPTAAVPATATSAGQGANGARGPRARPRVTEPSIPAYMLDPRRVPSIQDIQARGKRLFEPMKSQEAPGLKVVLKAWQPNAASPSASAASASAKPKRSGRGADETGSTRVPLARPRVVEPSIPAYMLNPHRVPSIKDIQARGRRLFEPMKSQDASGLKVVLKAWQPNPALHSPLSTPPPAKPKRSGRRTTEPGASRKHPGFRKTDNPLPPYARNPRRVPGIADIERRSRQLFEPLKGASESALQIKIGSIKALTRSRSASSVAAYLSRQADQQRLRPYERRTQWRIDRQYFQLRRAVFSDIRLTRQDKAQMLSVLSFERLKAHHAIQHPKLNQEVSLMGSASIRKLITEEKEDPGFSIGGAPSPEPEGIRFRVKRILDNLSRQIDPEVKTERERELNAKDLYTRKARFSQNVHYLDKKTDKTLFVDTGKVIAMRRTGITEAGVAVALQLAKERFGSTLTINGSADFKKLVIEATAKSGMDIHFTDKAMNEGLAARRAELEIEKEGQSIQPAPATTEGSEQSGQQVDTTQGASKTQDESPVSTPAAPDVRQAPAAIAEPSSMSLEERIDLRGWVGEGGVEFWTAYDKAAGGELADAKVGHYSSDLHSRGFITYASSYDDAFSQAVGALRTKESGVGVGEFETREASFPPASAKSAAVAESSMSTSAAPDARQAPAAITDLNDLVARDAQWLADLQVSDQTIRGSDTAMGMRGGYHAMWLVGADSPGPGSQEMVESLLEYPAYRDGFKSAVEDLYRQAGSPDEFKLLDEITGFAVSAVNRIEDSPQAVPGSAAEAKPASRKLIEGVLVSHGAAPYQHNPDKQQSYFATVRTETGERTAWGVGLAEALQGKDFKPGDFVQLEDHGTQPVTVEVVAPDGKTVEKTTYRREWTAEHAEPEKALATSVAPVAHDPSEPEQEPGLDMD